MSDSKSGLLHKISCAFSNDPFLKIEKKYQTRFWVGMAAYVVTIFASSTLVAYLEQSILSYILILLPTIPAVYAMGNVFQGMRKLDELEQRIQLESMMITMFIAALFAFTWGLLEYADLVPHFSTFMFAPGIIAIWGIASHFVRRRYA